MDRRTVLKTLGAAAGASTLGAGSLFSRAARAADSGGAIKLGFISSLTGSQAPLGQPMLMGAQIAVDQINKAGGVGGKRLELVIRDDKAKPADATVALRELAGNGVNLNLGLVSSAVGLALEAMLADQKAVLMTCAPLSDKLTHENFSRNYFRVTYNAYMSLRALAKLAAQHDGNITAWTGIIPDHEFGRTTWACFEDGLAEFYPSIAKHKVTVSDTIKVPYDSADYRSGIIAAMASPAEGFMVSSYGGDAVTLFKQAAAFGFFKKAKVIIDAANEFVVAKAMKQDLPDMWVGSHWYYGAFTDVPTSNELQAEAVRRTNDKYTLGWVAEGHAAVMAYAKAIQAAGSTDTDAIINALESITFDSATGPRHFRKEDHQAIKPVVAYRLRGNAKVADGFEILDSVRIPGEDVIEPPAPGKPMVLRKV